MIASEDPVIPFSSKQSVLWAPLPMVVLRFPPLILSAVILPVVTNMKLPQNTEEAIELSCIRGAKKSRMSSEVRLRMYFDVALTIT